MASGTWLVQDQSLHINNLELRAVRLALLQFQSQVQDHCVLLSSDNTTVVAFIKKRGDTFVVPVSGVSSSLQRVFAPGSCSPGKTHPRQAQRPGGRAEPPSADSSFRVDSVSGGSQHCFPPVGDSSSRPLRNKAQPSSSDVRVPCSGSKRLGGGRPVPRLVESNGLCLSTFRSPSSCSSEDQGLPLSDPLDCTLVAPEVLVQRPSGSTLPGAKVSSKKSGSSVPKSTASSKGSSSKPRHSASSRLAVVRQALRKRKFSSRAAQLISSARRDSTSQVYNAKWRVYHDWCIERQVDPVDPSLRRVADFLVFLFDEKKLAVSTIKGYRSMLSRTLSFRKASTLGSDPILSELIRSFELKRPVSRSLAPKWDLSCVLWSLSKAPYEPLDLASLQLLTWKTVFLLTLAAAKRRSEIHALSVEEGHLRFNEADGSVSLLCQPGFLAKTQLPSVAHSPIVIPSLSRNCGREDEDRFLCPVRALKFYLHRVKPSRGQRKRLFLPLKKGGNITASSISRWIACTIRKAYTSLSDRDISSLKFSAHEVRALSSSWAFVNHAPLKDILQASYWKSPSTFSSFYLRSFSHQRDNLSALGPLVVSERVITPASSSSSGL